jgi:putrescine transport system permease protein
MMSFLLRPFQWIQSFSLFDARRYRLIIVPPYVWLFLFFFVPFLLIVKISFSKAIIALPPFEPIFTTLSDHTLRIHIFFKSYINLFQDDFYIGAFLSSLGTAGCSTLGCLLIGYMMAYGLSRLDRARRPFFLLLVVLPFWTSFLIRIYAWMSLLSTHGLINTLLLFMGIIHEPISMLDNTYAVCVGIIYCYLPFMILPIYAALEKIDLSLIEASFDLGATPWRTFWHITVPLSLPGVVAGCILVFVPAMGEFVIPELLGGPDTIMIGRVLWWEFFNNRDWPQACAVAVMMILVFVLPIMFFQRQQQKIENT